LKSRLSLLNSWAWQVFKSNGSVLKKQAVVATAVRGNAIMRNVFDCARGECAGGLAVGQAAGEPAQLANPEDKTPSAHASRTIMHMTA
jgi:hypothetical protein